VKYFILIWAALWRKPARTILTMLSVIVAFVLFGVLQGFNANINSLNSAASNRLWTMSRVGQTEAIPFANAAQIRRIPGVRHVADISFFGGYFQDSHNSIGAYATTVREMAAVYPELNITPEQVKAMEATRTGALVGKPLADKLGWKVGDHIPLGTTIWTDKSGSNTWPVDIVGIFAVDPSFRSSNLADALWINQTYFDEARRFGNGGIHQFLISIDDPHHAAEISQAIDKLFENSPNETRTQPENAAIAAQLKQFADINFIVSAIVGAVFFTLLFLTANTMLQSVRERIPELAVLRTLGYSGRAVLALVLVEAFLMCACAAFIGLGLAWFAMKGIQKIVNLGDLQPAVLITGIAIATLLALASGLPPAWRAKRLNIVDALAGR
jgi:putative ABC transport system permease protein